METVPDRNVRARGVDSLACGAPSRVASSALCRSAARGPSSAKVGFMRRSVRPGGVGATAPATGGPRTAHAPRGLCLAKSSTPVFGPLRGRPARASGGPPRRSGWARARSGEPERERDAPPVGRGDDQGCLGGSPIPGLPSHSETLAPAGTGSPRPVEDSGGPRPRRACTRHAPPTIRGSDAVVAPGGPRRRGSG